MVRKSVSQDVQAKVLLSSRRRCCICFGLNRDTSIKQGQIAHLDQDPNNNVEKNLAFLCFNHHDQYDSQTKQSKNFTKQEVLIFKEELVLAIQQAFSAAISFGEASIPNEYKISGHYIRDGEFESADIKVQLLENQKYHVNGLALWGKSREYGPNIGELDFIAALEYEKIEYVCSRANGKLCRVVFDFSNEILAITEENCEGMYGMNVTFSGRYHKAT